MPVCHDIFLTRHNDDAFFLFREASGKYSHIFFDRSRIHPLGPDIFPSHPGNFRGIPLEDINGHFV